MCLDSHSRLLLALVISLCYAGATPAHAQETQPSLPPGPLTLEQALEVAEARSEGVGIARAAIRRADGEHVRARSGLFPQLSATGSYDRSLASEFEGVFDDVNFGNAPDTPPADDGGLEDLPFGRSNTWRATLSFSQNLYSGGRIGAQTALARVGRETAEFGVTTARAQVLFDVTQAYYDAALADRLVAIAASTVEQASATLKQTQASFDAGTQPEFEVLRARVNRDNQTPQLIRQRANREVAMQRLKQLLELPVGFELRLADTLGDEKLPPPAVFAERVALVENTFQADAASFAIRNDLPLPDRTVVAEAGATVRLREASLRLVEVERMPSVALNSTLSRIAYPSGFAPTFDRMNWSVGASVSVPILTGGRQRGDELVARAELEQARLQRQQVEELAALETRSAWAELAAARAAWVATAGTVEQASRAYEIADVRYRAGVSTQLELSDSRLLLQQADANRAQAARDLQVARARVALLPGLPLRTGGAAPSSPGAPAVPQAPSQTPTPSAPLPQGGGQFRTAAAQTGPTQAGTR